MEERQAEGTLFFLVVKGELSTKIYNGGCIKAHWYPTDAWI